MEIEKAIETLEEIYPSKKQIVTGEYPDVAEALDAALAALRKQREREKGCEYYQPCGWCSNFNKPCDTVCGRRLKEAQSDENA